MALVSDKYSFQNVKQFRLYRSIMFFKLYASFEGTSSIARLEKRKLYAAVKLFRAVNQSEIIMS